MTFRIDPSLEERLADLVDGLPARNAPRLPERMEPDRVPRIVLAIWALILVVAAIIGLLWLINQPILPGASLTCDQIDIFRCRTGATTAAAWFEAVLPADPHHAGEAINSIEVWNEPVEENICRPEICPEERRENISHVDIVKVGYSAGGHDWVTLVWCRDGEHWIGGTTLGPWFGPRKHEPPC